MARIYPAPPSAGGNGHEERGAQEHSAGYPAVQIGRQPALPSPVMPPALAKDPDPSRSFPAGLTGGLLSGAVLGGLAALLLGVLLRRKRPSATDR